MGDGNLDLEYYVAQKYFANQTEFNVKTEELRRHKSRRQLIHTFNPRLGHRRRSPKEVLTLIVNATLHLPYHLFATHACGILRSTWRADLGLSNCDVSRIRILYHRRRLPLG